MVSDRARPPPGWARLEYISSVSLLGLFLRDPPPPWPWPWADDRAVPPLLPLWTLPDLSLSEW